MTAEKSLDSIQHEIAGERAGALGRSGRRLRVALDALQRFDGSVADAQQSDRVGRSKLVQIASDAFWLYVVQREALGLVDVEYVRREYGVPAEVWRYAGSGEPGR
jgi:hypothetical protein